MALQRQRCGRAEGESLGVRRTQSLTGSLRSLPSPLWICNSSAVATLQVRAVAVLLLWQCCGSAVAVAVLLQRCDYALGVVAVAAQ